MSSTDSPDQGEPTGRSQSETPRSADAGYLASQGGCAECGSLAADGQGRCAQCGTPLGGGIGHGLMDAVSGSVYAIGLIEPRFPSIGVEKEFAQLVGRASPKKLDDRELLRVILAERANRYLARRLCWVFVANEIDAFVLEFRDSHDFDELVELFTSSDGSQHVVAIGAAGPPGRWACEPRLPRCVADQLMAFDLGEFVSAVPAPDDIDDEVFRGAVRTVFERIARRAENRGLSDEHRALNFAALRYPAIYEAAARAASRSMSLQGIGGRTQGSGDGRRIVRLRLSFGNRADGLVEQYGCQIDTTEVFPFLVSPLQQVFDG